jgi:RNA ligase
MRGEWNYFETVSRGLIINRVTGEIVARPLDKFFNWMERGRKAKGHIVTVTEKVDGSMGILYRHDGKFRVATRGSFNSEQAQWATEYLNTHFNLEGLDESLTLIFEIVYPQNRVVVDYGDREDLVLLAARNRFTGETLPFWGDHNQLGVYEIAYKYGFNTPQVYNFNDMTAIIERCGIIDGNQEGFVVEFSDGSRWKLKGDRYLELHKLVSGTSFKNTVRAYMSNSLDKWLDSLPDEFIPQVKVWQSEIEAFVTSRKEAVTNAFSSSPIGISRRAFVKWVQDNYPELKHHLFAMVDGKDFMQIVFKELMDMKR